MQFLRPKLGGVVIFTLVMITNVRATTEPTFIFSSTTEMSTTVEPSASTTESSLLIQHQPYNKLIDTDDGPTPKPMGQDDATKTLMKALQEKIPPDEGSQKSLISSLQSALDTAGSGGKKLAWVKKIRSLPPILASEKTPLNATDWLRFQVKLEVLLQHHLDDSSKPHPSSSDYPGSVDSSADQTKKVVSHKLDLEQNEVQKHKCQIKQESKVSCQNYCSTSYYAPPGSKVKVKVKSPKISSGVVRIGLFPDTTQNDLWTQYPAMTVTKPLDSSGSVSLNIAFGGMVYIGKISTPSDTNELELEISGVLPSMSWRVGSDTLVDWREDILQRNVPWGDLISQQITLSLPRAVLLTIDDPEEILIHWERILDGINEFVGAEYKSTRQHVSASRDLPNNNAIVTAGNPLFVNEKHAEFFTEFTNLWSDKPLIYAMLHALGHNHAKNLPFLAFLGDEVRADVFLDYVKVIVHKFPMSTVRKEYSMTSIAKVLGLYLSDGKPDFKDFVPSGASRLFHFDFVRNFGWGTYTKLVVAASANNTTESSSIDWFAETGSDLEESSLLQYLRSWGIPVSKDAEKRIATNRKEIIRFKAYDLLDLAEQETGKKRMMGRGMGKSKKKKKTTVKPDKASPDLDGELDDDSGGPEVVKKHHQHKPTEAPSVSEDTTTSGTVQVTSSSNSSSGVWKAHKLNSSASNWDQLLAGVSSARIDKPYAIILSGPTSFPIVVDKLSRPVLAGAVIGGNARIIYAERSFLMAKYEDHKTDAEQLRVNLIFWAASHYDEGSVPNILLLKYSKFSSKAFGQWLTDGGNTVTTTKFEGDNPYKYLEKSNADLLIVPEISYLPKDAGPQLLKFLKKGKGIILASADDCGDVPLNKELSEATGLSWSSQLIKETVFQIQNPPRVNNLDVDVQTVLNPTSKTETDLTAVKKRTNGPEVKVPSTSLSGVWNAQKLSSSASNWDQLLAGVSTARIDKPYALILSGPNSFPIVVDKLSTPVLAGAVIEGKGRILYVERSFLLAKYEDHKTDAEQLRVNLILWAASHYEESSVPNILFWKYSKVGSKAFGQWLSDGGNTVTTTKFEGDNPYKDLEKDNTELLILPEISYLPKDAGPQIIKFLKKGKGVIIGSANDCSDVPLNKELSETTGLKWSSQVIKETVFQVQNPPAINSLSDNVQTVQNGLRLFINTSMDSLGVDNKFATEFAKALANLQTVVKDIGNLNETKWVAELKELYLQVPSVPSNVSNVSELMRARVGLDRMMTTYVLSSSEQYAHPASRDHPGWINETIANGSGVPADLSKTFRYTLKLRKGGDSDVHNCTDEENSNRTKVSCDDDFCPTPFYVQPGKLVTLKFLTGNVSEFTILNPFHHEITRREMWVHYPDEEYKKKFKNDNAVLSAPFGGCLLLSEIRTLAHVETVEMEITGVGEMPHFILGDTKLSDWKRIRDLNAPYSMMSSPSMNIRLQTEYVRNVDNPEEIMLAWERFMDVVNEFLGKPYKGGREAINFEQELHRLGTKGGRVMGLSTTPISIVNDFANSAMSTTRLIANIFFHEMGHHNDPHWWKFNGGDQITNEIWGQYLRWSLFGWHKLQASSSKGIDYDDSRGTILRDAHRTMQVYLVDRNANYDKYFQLDGLSKLFYYDLHLNFGWNVYFYMAKEFENVTIKDDQQRRDTFLVFLSKYTKRDMNSYLASWGFQFSKDTLRQVNDLGYQKSAYSAQTTLKIFATMATLDDFITGLEPNKTAILKYYRDQVKHVDFTQLKELKASRTKKIEEVFEKSQKNIKKSTGNKNSDPADLEVYSKEAKEQISTAKRKAIDEIKGIKNTLDKDTEANKELLKKTNDPAVLSTLLQDYNKAVDKINVSITTFEAECGNIQSNMEQRTAQACNATKKVDADLAASERLKANQAVATIMTQGQNEAKEAIFKATNQLNAMLKNATEKLTGLLVNGSKFLSDAIAVAKPKQAAMDMTQSYDAGLRLINAGMLGLNRTHQDKVSEIEAMMNMTNVGAGKNLGCGRKALSKTIGLLETTKREVKKIVRDEINTLQEEMEDFQAKSKRM